ncbi:kinase-like protein [Coniochaeta sp. PMI_546]|nr:kinase-like protein [Coniochaeta sp. PMI_546]
MATSNADGSADRGVQSSPQHADQKTSNSQDSAQEEYHSYGYLPMIWDHEDLDQYSYGGLHPIIIGDTLGDDSRYKVYRKLGAGGSATIWLCRDQVDNKWVAVKVLGAKASFDAAQCQIGEMAVLKHFRDLEVDDCELAANHVCLPDDYFVQRGPNGDHFCFILPVLGGDVRWAWVDYGYKPEVLREICAQMVKAMSYLHSKRVCHGDFRPSNIMYTHSGIENATQDEIDDMFPESEEVELGPIPATGEEPGPALPRFIYSSTCLRRQPEQSNVSVVVSDFGEAYILGNSPENLGIPLRYAAPEVLLNPYLGFNFATDVWSLGASILEIRHNQQFVIDLSLFDAVRSMEENLGPLPEPYRAVWFSLDPVYRRFAGDEAEIPSTEPVTMSSERLVGKKESILGAKYASFLERDVRELRGLGLRMEPGEDLSKKPGQRLARDGICKWIEYQIPAEEADQLLDLLLGIFKYEPEDRLSVQDIMDHPWFSGRFLGADDRDNDPETEVENKVREVINEVGDEETASEVGIKGNTDELREDENEVFFDAVGVAAVVVPARGIAHILAQFRGFVLAVVWRLRRACFGA